LTAPLTCATVATGASAKKVLILDAVNLFSLNAANPILVPVKSGERELFFRLFGSFNPLSAKKSSKVQGESDLI